MKEYFVYAIKNLKRRGIRSYLTLLGVFIGIASVVSLISLGAALKDTVTSQFVSGSTDLITIQAGGLNGYGPPGSGAVNHLTKNDLEAIKELSLVDIVIGRNIGNYKTKFNKKLSFPYFASIPDDETKKDLYNFLDLKISQGRFIESGDNNVVLVGNRYVSKDNSGFEKALKPGDRIEVKDLNFTVVGILEKKGSFTIDQIILMQQKDMDKLEDNNNTLDIIVAKIKSKDDMEQAKLDIEKLLRSRRNVKEGEEDFSVSTPEAALATVNQVLTGIQIFIVIIASISIIVGGIGIANTMYASVLERKKEIGTMKAIGARNSNIFYQFFVEAGFLGIIGGILGIIGGVLVGIIGVNALNSFLGTSTKINLNYTLFILVLLGSFLIGSISGILPAMRAAKLNPVQALRE